MICLSETWFNDSCFNCNFFPGTYLVCRSGRMSVEKTFSDDFNFLIGYRYFASDTTVDTHTRYFACLEHVFEAHNFRVLLGDFIVPLFDWKLGLSPAVSHCYNKLQGKTVFPPPVCATCLRIIICATVATCLTLCFLILLIFLLSTMYTCWCPVILASLLNCGFLLENQISLLIFLSENILLVIAYCFATHIPPTNALLSTV